MPTLTCSHAPLAEGVGRAALGGAAVTRWRIHRELKDRGDIAALRLMGKVKQTEHGPRYDVAKV
jgi:hypothetical protein